MTKKEQKNIVIGLGFMGLAFGAFWFFRKKETVNVFLPTQVKFES